MTNSYLIIGSNSIDKNEKISNAVLLISKQIGTIILKSSIYQTAAWGYESPNNYLNQVILIKTSLTADKLLEQSQEIEKELGRKIKSVNGQYQDRPIDIDILSYGQKIIKKENLEIPHPRMCDRRFVLEPLCEIAPNFNHPIKEKTITELLEKCQDELLVEKL